MKKGIPYSQFAKERGISNVEGKTQISFQEEQEADMMEQLRNRLVERNSKLPDLISNGFGFSLALSREERLELIRHWINNLQDVCHEDSVKAGWYTNLETGQPFKPEVGGRIALIHSEISEAFEAHRKDLMDDHLPHRSGLEVELSDAVIRILDFAGSEGLDLAGAIIEKLEYNLHRQDHKIENRRKPNGKKV